MEDAQRFILASHSWADSALMVLGVAVVVLGGGVVPAAAAWRWLRRGRGGASATPAAQPVDPHGKKRRWIEQRLTRRDLLWVGPLLAITFGVVLLNERPRALWVRGDRIDLEYRLPRRDRALRYSAISRVELLERSRTRRTAQHTWPVLIINHAGDRYEIMAHTARYYAAVRAAHGEIRRRMAAAAPAGVLRDPP